MKASDPQSLSLITTVISRKLRNDPDTEDLAMNIWLSCFLSNVDISPRIIRLRCISYIRTKISDRNRFTNLTHTHQAFTPSSSLPPTDLLNSLISRAHLSTLESQILYSKFYQSSSVSTLRNLFGPMFHTILASALTKLRSVARSLSPEDLL